MHKNRNYVKAKIKALTPISEPRNEPYHKLEFFILVIIILLGIFVRLTPIFSMQGTLSKLGQYYPTSDDGFFHQHIINEILEYGHIPDPNPLSWLGHPATYPPLYHYTVAYISILTHQPSWFVFFIFPVFIGLISIISVYLLCRKLYGPIGGIVAAGTVAFSQLIALDTNVGTGLPSALAIPLFILSSYFILKGGLHYSILAGLVYGLSCLTWAGSLIFYLPVFVTFFFLSLGRNSLRLKLRDFLATASVFTVIVSPFYLPIVLKYGISSFLGQNVPFVMTRSSSWSDSWYVLRSLQLYGAFFTLFIVSIPFVLYLSRRNRQYRYALIWLVPALITVSLGTRWLQVYFNQALILSVAGFLSFLYYSRGVSRLGVTPKTPYRIFVKLTLILLFIYSFNIPNYLPLITSNQNEQPVQFYPAYASYVGIEKVIPKGSTVLAWWNDGYFISYFGFKNVWDGFTQQVPSWGPERAKDVATIYLSPSESESLSILNRLNVSYVLVSKAYVNNYLSDMVRTYNEYENPITYVSLDAERRTVQGLSQKGSETLFGKLAFPERTEIIFGVPVVIPSQLENFELVWQSSDNLALLYRVKGGS